MFAVITNRGKSLFQKWSLRGLALPAHFYVVLLKKSTLGALDPDNSGDLAAIEALLVDLKTMSEVAEVPSGNGYTTGGYSLTPNSTDFPAVAEDDTANEATITAKDVVWTASGGYLPTGADSDSTKAARLFALITDEATVANRQIVAIGDLGALRFVSDGQAITLHGIELAFTEAA